MAKKSDLDTELAKLEKENQALGKQADAIQAKRTAIRVRMDALVQERHRRNVLGASDDVAAPGAVVESGAKAAT